MGVRITFVAHGETSATIRHAFPLDEPLTARGATSAGRMAAQLHEGHDVTTSSSARCRQTAAAWAVGAHVDRGLDDWDLGRWAGQRLDDVEAAESANVLAWLTDAGAAPHGGESLSMLGARVALWLDAKLVATTQRLVAVTHPAIVRCAVVQALGAPITAFWRLDVPPLGTVKLSGRAGRWNVTL